LCYYNDDGDCGDEYDDEYDVSDGEYFDNGVMMMMLR
jgi:hypothetical protein